MKSQVKEEEINEEKPADEQSDPPDNGNVPIPDTAIEDHDFETPPDEFSVISINLRKKVDNVATKAQAEVTLMQEAEFFN